MTRACIISLLSILRDSLPQPTKSAALSPLTKLRPSASLSKRQRARKHHGPPRRVQRPRLSMLRRAGPSGHVPGALADDGGPEIEQLAGGRAGDAEGLLRIWICLWLGSYVFLLWLWQPLFDLTLQGGWLRLGSRTGNSVRRPEREEDVRISSLTARHEALPASRFAVLSVFASLPVLRRQSPAWLRAERSLPSGEARDKQRRRRNIRTSGSFQHTVW